MRVQNGTERGSGLTAAGAPSQPLAMAGAAWRHLPSAFLAGSQLQLPHVPHHSRGIEGLLPGTPPHHCAAPGTAVVHPLPPPNPVLTFHLLLAKFFLICSLTDWWMFLSRAVSPAILE